MPPAFVKRVRMDAALTGLVAPTLPAGFVWLAWHERLLPAHADTLAASFAAEPDAVVFPNLGRPDTCRRLMTAIRDSDGFCPAATWLVAGPDGAVGTVQGILDGTGGGWIQNVGVVPAARHRGIGRALVRNALLGFAAGGATRAYLDVTARNAAAVRLYRRLGFRHRQTLFRQLPRPDHAGAGI